MSPYRKRQDIYTNTQICHRIERDRYIHQHTNMSPYRKRQDIYTNTQICHR